MQLLYIIGSYFVFVLLLPALLLHPKLRDGWARRLGFYPTAHPPPAPEECPEASGGPAPAKRDDRPSMTRSGRHVGGGSGAPRIWFHGASAGDLSALSPMIHEMRRRRPEAVLIVSCLTNSGAVMARHRLGVVDEITYQPWDLAGATRRAVAAIRPDLLVLEYTEIWPNLIRAASRFGAHVVLTNGRFSERKIGRYKALFAISGQPLSRLGLLLMRTEEEAERALALGAAPERVLVTGNTKFDALLVGDGADPSGLQAAFGLDSSSRVLVAGSTHEGEEQIILATYRRLLELAPDLRLVIAPRYLERVPRVVTMIERAGFRARLRSKTDHLASGGSGSAAGDGDPGPAVAIGGGTGTGPGTCPPDHVPSDCDGRIVGVLDTMGELVTCYRLASMVFVGGSFTKRGGQNILEPAAQGSPVVFGPNMSNFRDSVQVLVGRGAIQVADVEQLHKVLCELLQRPKKLRDLGELARRTVHGVRGASERNVDAMMDLLWNAGAGAAKVSVAAAARGEDG